MEETVLLPHKLTLNERKELTMTGVTQVVSFDEEGVILKIGTDTLIIRGENLELKTLNPEGGQVAVHGHITALTYEQRRSAGGFWHRLVG